MPYGLTGTTQTCQHGLFHKCHDCVDNYVDDIFSDDMDSHITDLRRVLEKLRVAGFTLNTFWFNHLSKLLVKCPHQQTRLRSLQNVQHLKLLKNLDPF